MSAPTVKLRHSPPVRAAAAIVAFYVVGQLALVTVCHEWPLLRHSTGGVTFEVVHSTGVILVVLGLALLPFCRARRSPWLHALCWAPFAGDALFRAADWVVYYHSGLHINLMATEHAHGAGLRLVFGFVPYLELSLPLIALGGAAWLAVRAYRAVGSVVVPPLRLLGPVLGLLACVGVASRLLPKPHTELATMGPEWSAYRSWLLAARERRCLADPACAKTMNQLDDGVRHKLTRFGIHVNPREPLPLYRPLVYKKALPFPRTDRWVEAPNVLLIFMESLSADLVDVYHPRTPPVTPNLDAFAAESMRVDNYYNATTPTVTSLVAGLCSFYPPAGHEEFGRAFFGALYCLSDVLAGHGYENTFIRGIQRSFAHVGDFLTSQRFRLLDRDDIAPVLNEPPASWGFSDHQLFRFLRHELEARTSAAPFFIGMTTVDLHPPFNLTRVAPVFSGPGAQLLDIVHSTDEAFGEFWQWFKSSRFAHDTVVVVVADHAIFPLPLYVQLRGQDWPKSYYDKITLLIHDPGVALPPVWSSALGTSVDLAPTILHLVGINEPNAFEGNSLFGDRHGQTGVLADHAYLLYSNQLDADGIRVIDNFYPRDCNEKEAPVLRLTECEQTRWHHWKARLLDQRRIWKK